MNNPRKSFLILVLSAMLLQPPSICYAQTENRPVKVILNNKRLSEYEKPIIYANTAYISLRSVCEGVGAELNWSDYARTAIIRYNKKVIRAQVKDGYVFVNNEKKGKAFIKNGKLMLPSRVAADIFGLNVQWDNDFKTVILSSQEILPDNPRVLEILTEPLPYTEEDVYWLSRIVNAEASGESYTSKLAVANVIINRQQHTNYPDTIKSVIFDKDNGVQFTPAANGMIYQTPSKESTVAAIDALSGENNAQNILFFMNPKKSTSFWITKNRSYAFTLENHDFYY